MMRTGRWVTCIVCDNHGVSVHAKKPCRGEMGRCGVWVSRCVDIVRSGVFIGLIDRVC